MFERLDVAVINLDRRPDRMGYIHQNIPFSFNPLYFMKGNASNNNPFLASAVSHGSYRRFPAIDGKNLSNYYNSNLEYRDLLETIRGKTRVLGEVGCSLSHYSLWRDHCLTPNSDYLLIFEDDVMFTDKSHQRMHETLNELQCLRSESISQIDHDECWDVMYVGGQWTPDYDINSRNSYFKYQGTTSESLGSYYNRTTTGSNIAGIYRRKNHTTAVIHGNNNVWYTPLFRTAGAYLVSKRGAKRLLEAVDTDTALFMKTPLDMWILEMDFRGYIDVFDRFPHPFYQAGFEMVKEPSHVANDIHRTTFDTVVLNDTICIFGASVTQQQSGYAVKLKDMMTTTNVHILGYGGNHLGDAGVCFLDNVIKIKPTYCFIDFFSTAYVKTDNLTTEYLDTIVYKLTNVKCRIVFLFMVRQDHDDEGTRTFYRFLKQYLNSRQLYYIDLNDHFKYSTELVRDTVHTTDIGSDKYAAKIYEIFKQSNIMFPRNITKTKYSDGIKILDVNKIFKNNVVLEGDCLIVAFYLSIGRNSGIVEINNTKHQIWDEWCHYERNHFNLPQTVVNKHLEIKILQDAVDYSKCRREITNDTGVDIIKELNIIGIYYIGKKLELSNVSS